jgi:hypothetical protein
VACLLSRGGKVCFEVRAGGPALPLSGLHLASACRGRSRPVRVGVWREKRKQLLAVRKFENRVGIFWFLEVTNLRMTWSKHAKGCSGQAILILGFLALLIQVR